MKTLTSIFLLVSTASSYAGTNISCKSANYGITLLVSSQNEKTIAHANYSINDWINDGADVVVEKEHFYLNQAIAVSLNVAEQPNKFELVVTSKGNSKKDIGKYVGKIITQNVKQKTVIQDATCTSEYYDEQN